MPVNIPKERKRVTQTHDLIRFFCAEEREPCIQFRGYIFILMFLPEDVKWDEDVVMQQFHGKAGI